MNEEPIRGTLETSTPAQAATMSAIEFAQELTDQTATLEQLAADVAYMKIVMVNVCFLGKPGNGEWVLVDAGLPGAEGSILEAAGQRFGIKPKAIVLTHGHFDHVGSITELVKNWDIPVYAHKLELPYLTGLSDYPRANPDISEGIMAQISPLYPRQAINLGSRVQPLPSDGSIPNLPGWRWIHTPGHTPGHVSLFRDSDRVLVAGDAFVTVKQESAWAVLTQSKEVHGPPAYFTPDWDKAGESVKRLMELRPSLAITGHGLPMRGEELMRQLKRLAEELLNN